jgi:hypothetical protein
VTKIVIGLSGKKRSGKGSFAQHLVAEHGFTVVSLAGPLRQAALDLNPIVGYDRMRDVLVYLSDALHDYGGWEGIKASPYADPTRRTLQRLGTEAIRKLDDGFWIRMAWERIDQIDGPVVIDDVRYPNEAMSLQLRRQKLCTYLVRINRPGLENADQHPSETALDAYPADFTVTNDRGLDWLHLKAALVLDDIHAQIEGAKIQ